MAPDHAMSPPFLRLAAHPLRWQLLARLATSDLRVRELVASVGESQNLVSYHLRLLRNAELVTKSQSSFDARDSYYHLDLDRCADLMAQTAAALHPSLTSDRTGSRRVPGRRSRPLRVLFACTGNSARSPVAEALLRERSHGTVEATSAGSHPRESIHPAAVRVLAADYGIDISEQRTRHLDEVTRRSFDYVITLCDKVREVCPEVTGQARPVHWSITDPAPATLRGRAAETAVRRTAQDIDARLGHLLALLASTDPQEDHA